KGHTTQIVTGKPVVLGGSQGREAATGRGVVSVLDQAVAHLELGSPAQLSVAIQGFGNVGSWAARLANERGYRVVAVSDVNGGIHHGAGIDVPKLVDHVAESGTVVDFPGVDRISNEQLLELDVDVLIPAALGEVVTHRNVDRLSSQL